MVNIKCDVAVIGSGPAGLASALAAKKQGAEVLLIERDRKLGGILQQCIHPGFGLQFFQEELTGPEYIDRFIKDIRHFNIKTLLGTMVLSLSDDGIICSGKHTGICKISAKSTVLAMGCRERTRANLVIPGSRPSGVYTAGTAQRLINMQGVMVGEKVVIIGSGDIGMIMARRLILEGAKVVAVVEIMDFLAGLTRNYVQCIRDFDIPLYFSHTVTEIIGNRRVQGVKIAPVDKNRKPVLSEETLCECDTVLFSVGLLPENELSKSAGLALSPLTKGPIINQYRQTGIPSIFACGNVTHVNDLADNVSVEGEIAGRYAAQYAAGNMIREIREINTMNGNGVQYVCPQKISVGGIEDDVSLYYRVSRPAKNVQIHAEAGGKNIYTKKILKVNPGEMQSITLSGNIIKDAKETLSIRMEENK
jgi:NADPH-dependent 2,4-dienoyl-CoA reductase/sulfur reductase-like enzyme